VPREHEDDFNSRESSEEGRKHAARNSNIYVDKEQSRLNLADESSYIEELSRAVIKERTPQNR